MDNKYGKRIDEQRQAEMCVWMQAGILSYKLCSLQFNCEECALDKIIKGSFSHNFIKDSNKSYPDIVTIEFEELVRNEDLLCSNYYYVISLLYKYFERIHYSPDVIYSSSHLWMYDIGKGVIRMGLDDFIVKCIEPIKRVVFPTESGYLREGATICRLFFDDWSLGLKTPFSGQLTAINHNALRNPGYIQHDSYGRGWCLDMRPESQNFHDSMTQKISNVEQWYKKCLIEIFDSISECMQPIKENLGPMAADGGQQVSNLRQVLGRDKYIRLINKFTGQQML